MNARIVWFLVWSVLAIFGGWLWRKTADVPISNTVALAQVNGGTAEFVTQNTVESARSNGGSLGFLIWLIVSLCIVLPGKKGLIACLWDPKSVRDQDRKDDSTAGTGKVAGALLVLLSMSLLAGCMRPFDKPEYKEIQPYQTAYVIPIDTEKATGPSQVKFASEEFLEQAKVAAKRVQIPHRWVKTGRSIGDVVGEYIPTVIMIVVDRSPVTREWESKDSGKKGGDKAIWTESADSVGFSMGWNVTAYIQEKDTSKFLYWYPSASLAAVLDTEVRGRIQMVAATESAKYRLDVLREKKNEIADAVRKDCEAFFTARGITLTSIGQFGGMSYENPKIQDAIDQTFISQQDKVNAAAFLAAQADKNTRILSEADALASAAAKKGKGEADAIAFVNEALAKAANNPQLIQLRALEVELARVKGWNGAYPAVVAGAGGNTWVGLGNVADLQTQLSSQQTQLSAQQKAAGK